MVGTKPSDLLLELNLIILGWQKFFRHLSNRRADDRQLAPLVSF